jgi:hypothetical protein
MNEIVEMIYQWHQGAGFKSIRRSLGFDRNTLRKYVALAQSVSVSRDVPFPRSRECALQTIDRGTHIQQSSYHSVGLCHP